MNKRDLSSGAVMKTAINTRAWRVAFLRYQLPAIGYQL